MDDSNSPHGSEQELTNEQRKELKRIAHQAAANLNGRQLYYLGSMILEMAFDLDPDLSWGEGE